MYKTLYRKWRPKSFDDVVGQNQVTNILANEVNNKRISHAYLFTGSRGTGKTSCAKILAKAINCEKPVNGNPCGKCEICKNIDSDSCLDVVEIDAASNNGVENIRDMREEMIFAPSKCRYRVYIVDEVHMLSAGAFNAFLKTLEEPPEHVVFILATTELQKLPLTIISRCQKFKFYKLSNEVIEKRIKHICTEEKIEIEPKAISLIASHSGGAMRDALSILDQCSNIQEGLINEQSVKENLGISNTSFLNDLVCSIFDSNTASALKQIDEIYMQSGNMVKLLEELIEKFRNFMVFKSSNIKLGEENENFFQICEKENLENIISCLEILQNARKNINFNINQKLEIEITVLKLCLKFSKNMVLDNKIKNEETEKDSPKIENKDYWQTVLNLLQKDQNLKSLYISLKNSKAHKEGNYILIESENSLSTQFLKKAEFRASLKEIINKVLGKPYNIGPYNKPKQKENSPMDILIKNAKQSNINIEINQEDN